MSFQGANASTGPVQQLAARHEAERFLELNYRVANSLQLVSSFLSLQEREAPDPKAKQALHTAAARVAAVGKIQRAVLWGHNRMMDLDPFLHSLCADLATLTGLAIEVEAEAIVVTAQAAENVAILISELVLIAANQEAGRLRRPVTIDCHRVGPGDKVKLTIVDHGSIEDHGSEALVEEVGMIILRSMAELLNGSLTFDRAKRLSATLVFLSPRRTQAALYS